MPAAKQPPVTAERLMQLGSGYAPPIIIGAAAANKVFDILAGGPKSVEEVSEKNGASVRGLRAIMNALVGLELLAKDRDGKYSLTPESDNFLVSGKPETLANFFPMATRRLIPLWLKLEEAVRTGQPPEARNQEEAGTNFFAELVENIIPMSYGAAQTLAEHLQDSKSELRVLDIAAGSGIWGIALAERSPRMRVNCG
jgi:3-hydroxy-5-methyl-1-naphthoate 3-O-methyltransferase